jgi:hypothetical protein
MNGYSSNGCFSKNTSTSFDALESLKARELLSVVLSNSKLNIC